ncbi:MAG: putative metal-dependent enzyme (double-stranded beta helix superfamily) [Polaribacter sp.]|jgi:predicted metal-dependent enzyme (double-stranded beta helix superfamily)
MQLNQLEELLQQASYKNIRELSSQLFPAILETKSVVLEQVNFNENTYCRNEINVGNPKFSLVIIGWEPGQFSPIHNHPEEGCMVIPFQGLFKEIRYNTTTVKPKASSIYQFGQIAYIDDDLGLHAFGNPSESERAVSLHIYSPGLFRPTIFEA